ncbi:unnamed protein product [Ectocarpus sp. 8 AP-2014]
MPGEKNRFRRHLTPDTRRWLVPVPSGSAVLAFSRFPHRRRSRVRCPVPGVRCPDISIPDCCLALCVPRVVVFSARSSTVVGSPPIFFELVPAQERRHPVKV